MKIIKSHGKLLHNTYFYVFCNKILALLASLTALLWFSQNTVQIAFSHNQKLITCLVGLPISFHNIKCRGDHVFCKAK